MQRILLVLNPVNLLAVSGLHSLLTQAGLDPHAVLERVVSQGPGDDAVAIALAILAKIALEYLA